MKFTDVLTSLRTGKWWMEEAPGNIQLFHYIMKCFVNQRILDRTTLQKTAYIQKKDGMAFEITPSDEKEAIFKEVLQREIQHPGWFYTVIKKWKELKTEQDRLNKTVVDGLENCSDQELHDLYVQLHKVNSQFVVFGTFIECLDPYSENLPERFQKQYHLTEEETREDLHVLSTPIERSFLTQEKIDFLQVCLGTMSLEQFQENYYWFETNYKDAPELTMAEIRKRVETLHKTKSNEEMQQEIQKTEEMEKEQIAQKKHIVRKLKLTHEDTVLFDLIAQFAHLMDFRKENMMRTTYSRYHIIVEIARRKNIGLDTIFRMTTEECL
ncbi:MAG: hypothetical protein AABX37_03410, partial [Nanoarchaeota archaeon]